MSSAVADSGTVQALTSLVMAPKQRKNLLPAKRTATLATLRQRIEQLFPTVSDFDSFCLDYFPAVFREFTDGMQRQARINLLLSSQAPEAILHQLSRIEQPAAAHHGDLLIDQARLVPLPMASMRLLPTPRNPYFSGREMLLQDVERILQEKRILGLCGLGGIGKTQIALEFAYRSADSYSHVFFVSAMSDEDLCSDLLVIARKLQLVSPQALPVVAIDALRQWMAENSGWLLICDRADDPQIAQRMLPRTFAGTILITSRSHSCQKLGITTLEVAEFSAAESVAFLLKRVVRQPASTTPEQAAEEQAICRMAEELGHLPLALEQAAAYLVETDASWTRYLQAYQRQRLRLIERFAPRMGDYRASLATTWQMNFDEIRRLDPAAAELLGLSAFLHPSQIPEELFGGTAAHLPPLLEAALQGDDPLRLDELLRILLRYSLIRRNSAQRTYSVPRPVQEVLRSQLTAETALAYQQSIVYALERMFPTLRPPLSNEDRQSCERLLPHVRAVQAMATIQTQTVGASLLKRCGDYVDSRGQYPDAVEMLKIALTSLERRFKPDAPETIDTMASLAAALRRQGLYQDSELLQNRVLSLLRTTYGEEDSRVAHSLINLAKLNIRMGHYREAERLLEVSLARAKRTMGELHSETGHSHVLFGLLYRLQARCSDALAHFESAGAIFAATLPQTDPRSAKLLNHKADLFRYLGRYDDALICCDLALQRMTQAYDERHPTLCYCLDNLGRIHHQHGKCAEAEALFNRSLALRELTLGPEHPNLAYSLNGLGWLLTDQGRLTEAEAAHRRALDLIERQLGRDHVMLSDSLHGLGTVYARQHQAGEAETMFRRALAIRETVLGVDHPDSAHCLGSIAELYIESAPAQAQALMQRPLDIITRTLGNNHPLHLHLQSVLARLASNSGQR